MLNKKEIMNQINLIHKYVFILKIYYKIKSYNTGSNEVRPRSPHEDPQKIKKIYICINEIRKDENKILH